jgi:hypothetical protein
LTPHRAMCQSRLSRSGIGLRLARRERRAANRVQGGTPWGSFTYSTPQIHHSTSRQSNRASSALFGINFDRRRRLMPADTVYVGEDAKYLRLLHRGSILRSRLSVLRRSNGKYTGALAAVRDALLQEHLSFGVRDWKRVHVMTIHKAKGKEFDEVIVYEGKYQHRIVDPRASVERIAQARRNLRVAVTRAKRKVTILTPDGDRSILL